MPTWHMTTHLTCTTGHSILAQWTLPEAHIEVGGSEGIQMNITAPCCRISYEGAFLEAGCLKCVECGADVPSPTVEALTRAECPPTEVHTG